MKHFWRQKQKRNRVVVVAAVVAVVVTITASKYKQILQGKEILLFREPIETKTGWKMMNTSDKWRKTDRWNSIENVMLKINNNPYHNNYTCKKIQKQMKTRFKGDKERKNPIQLIQSELNTQTNLNIDLNCISPSNNTPHKSPSPQPLKYSPSPTLEETLAIIRLFSTGDPR
ncbi:MAG: hypothetical protein EZS28_020737 [Streblomastix strix]|uniref:Uncharacterized protein n=1 Tax=Streblomastix strix TaxID=222440 RepID=A0A5J4VN53_9EUKA|nr:MAG: hypothetical protein EZS28_020737 [Streblomastix strix]